jgi:acetolactate synthase-1/2/3 large subunit
MTRRMTGGHALAEMLGLHGVDLMFGMGGFQLLPMYEGLRTLGINHHLIADERSGAFAADAYSRVTGKVAVVDATLGPGATNLVSALVESLNAGIPMVALVGDSHRQFSGRYMTQEGPQVEILRESCKELIRVEAAGRIPELMRRAFQVATVGRPGPVVVDVPEDICHELLDYQESDFWVDQSFLRVPAKRTLPERTDIDSAVALLKKARKPAILAGGGIHLSRAYDELSRFAAKIQAPVAYTISGKGALADSDPLAIGLAGRYSRFANEIFDETDCLVVVGCKLGEIATKRYTLPSGSPELIHIDIDPDALSRWKQTTVGLWGDAASTLAALSDGLGDHAPDRHAYLEQIASHRSKWSQQVVERLQVDSLEAELSIPEVLQGLASVAPSDTVVVADGGFAAHWSSLYWDTQMAGRSFVANRGFASIGYGLPGCLGASIGAGPSRVVGVTGDGGFNMSVGELETCVRIGADFVLLVLNNAASGYIKALQHAVYGAGNYQSSDLCEIDYAQVAQSYGATGIRVAQRADLLPALQKALETRGPVVVDIVVTRDPARMLPGIDSRTALKIAPGDRPA